MVKGKILPMGLYGCEVAPLNEAVLTRFRGAIANVVTFTTSRRSVDLTYAVTAGKGDLGPDVEICKRRVTALGRCYHRNEEEAGMIQEINSRYTEGDEPATKHTKEDLQGKDELGPSVERKSQSKQALQTAWASQASHGNHASTNRRAYQQVYSEAVESTCN